jgi:hypothetical protein
MTCSIYQFTKDKLLAHGVNNTDDGSLTLTDKALFLKFVKLERTVRLGDFDCVQAVVQNIKDYTEDIEKRHLVAFAYMYLYFSEGTPKLTHTDEQLQGGAVRKSMEHTRDVTPNERLIADWARIWYHRYSPVFLSVIYATN